MTARSERRRRRTVIGALIGLSLVVAAAGLAAVGANAIANSTGGETVEADGRPVVSLPATDNAALAVVDDQGRLTSLVVVTLLPSGQGGTIVTVPVTGDVNAGASEPRVPLSNLLDPDDPSAFFEQVEATLAITLQFGEIVGADRLSELLEPTLPADVDLPIDVIDSGDAGDGWVVASGETRLSGPLLAQTLQAIDVDATERQRHAIDVSVWSGVAGSAPVVAVGTSVPTDDLGRPVSSATIDELFARLWIGPVEARDLALDPNVSDGSRPDLDAEAVVLDRRDSVLVFAQISPARVSTPYPGPVFRVEIPISDAQLDASDSGFASRQQLGLDVIGRLLFVAANVVSVDATQDPDGAPVVTRIEVADPGIIDAMNELGMVMFGEFDVVVAEQLIDGVDVVVRLGTGYLESQPAPAEQDDEQADGVAGGESDAPTTDGAGTVDADG
jgi:hypothetical protein